MSSVSVPPKAAQLGPMGLGVMGENLALNIEHNAYSVALLTRKEAKVEPRTSKWNDAVNP